MLRGVASARCGSNRLGIHSHSWQSRKEVRTELSWVAFVAASSGLPTRCFSPAVRWA